MNRESAAAGPVTTVELKPPYLILVGAERDPTYAKTGLGIAYWRPGRVAGQLRFAGCGVDLGVPDMSVAEAAAAGVGSLVVGVAPVGGRIPEAWWSVLEEAAGAGLDIVCGLHAKLNDRPGLVRAARSSGARLVEVCDETTADESCTFDGDCCSNYCNPETLACETTTPCA